MPYWPQTLLARSVLLIAALLVLAHLAWLQIFRVSTREPRARQVSQQIVSTVNLTRAALVTAEPSKRYSLLGEIAEREGVQVHVAKPGETLAPLPKTGFYEFIESDLRAQLGADTRFTLSRDGVEGLWVSFDIDGDAFWVLMPESRLAADQSWRWIGWGVLVLLLAVAGAFLIVARINRPLRALTQAAAQMGRGATPAPVDETGPSEIRTLSRAFNRMAADRKALDDERALLLAGVSHDLRTPLARLRLGMEMLDDKGDASLRAGIVQDIEDIDGAIGQFLDFARAASSESAVPDADLNALVGGLAARYERAGKPVTLQTGPVPPLPLRTLAMQRLVGNLIDNALRHGGDEVTVATGCAGGDAFVDVLDRGPGIPPDQAERMLQPFTRMDAARSTSGTGLGLAIVDRIAKMHGGSVQLLAREGGGLRARVVLPVASPAARRAG
jgi:two-component system, OmpR family, osmolarity sensor histidine kinase EnvZ